MACRVRVEIKRGDRRVEAVALVNSGFETDEPDIVIPVNVARNLGLWPPSGSDVAMLDTGGGETVNPYYRECANLRLLLEDREAPVVRVNVIVNPYVDEVVISDYVSSVLGIVLLDLREGLWRLRDDPPGTVRRSARRP